MYPSTADIFVVSIVLVIRMLLFTWVLSVYDLPDWTWLPSSYDNCHHSLVNNCLDI